MSELQNKTDGDLTTLIREKREELHKLQFGATGSNMRNTHAIRNVKREIAQALTELQARSKKS